MDQDSVGRLCPVIALNMSGILEEEEDIPLTEPLIDCRDIAGTDCYCDDIAKQMISDRLEDHGTEGVHFLDSGNYHYLSLLFMNEIPREQDFELVLFDNHPDSQEPAFGEITSCGGWVREAWETMPNLKQVTMIGVDPELLLDEGYSDGVNVIDRGEGWDPIRVTVAVGESHKSYRQLLNGTYGEGNREDSLESKLPVYISVDKDVLRVEDAQCNWSQGEMRKDELLELLKELKEGREVLGIDVCGEEDAQAMTEATKLNERTNCEIAELMAGTTSDRVHTIL